MKFEPTEHQLTVLAWATAQTALNTGTTMTQAFEADPTGIRILMRRYLTPEEIEELLSSLTCTSIEQTEEFDLPEGAKEDAAFLERWNALPVRERTRAQYAAFILALGVSRLNTLIRVKRVLMGKTAKQDTLDLMQVLAETAGATEEQYRRWNNFLSEDREEAAGLLLPPERDDDERSPFNRLVH